MNERFEQMKAICSSQPRDDKFFHPICETCPIFEICIEMAGDYLTRTGMGMKYIELTTPANIPLVEKLLNIKEKKLGKTLENCLTSHQNGVN